MKDTKSILLLLLSAGLIATWIFYISEKTKNENNRKATLSGAIPDVKTIQDSLQLVYENTLNQMGIQLNAAKSTADTLQGQLDARIQEILQLKSEIAVLLKKINPKQEDLSLAGQKTTRLQQLVSSLPKQKRKSSSTNLTSPETETINSSDESYSNYAIEKTVASPNFTVSNLTVSNSAFNTYENNETETNQTDNKLTVSFSVTNPSMDYPNAELFAIVTQPDGKVIQEPWESASVETKSGIKKYTRKLKFEYRKGETKQVQFKINAAENEKGFYTLQVYHNGLLVGQSRKMLN